MKEDLQVQYKGEPTRINKKNWALKLRLLTGISTPQEDKSDIIISIGLDLVVQTQIKKTYGKSKTGFYNCNYLVIGNFSYFIYKDDKKMLRRRQQVMN